MMNLDGSGSGSRLGTLQRVESFALEQMVALHCASGDLRWALAALIAQSITSTVASGRARLVAKLRGAPAPHRSHICHHPC